MFLGSPTAGVEETAMVELRWRIWVLETFASCCCFAASLLGCTTAGADGVRLAMTEEPEPRARVERAALFRTSCGRDDAGRRRAASISRACGWVLLLD